MFITVEIPKNIITKHIAVFENEKKYGAIRLVLERTITQKKNKISALKAATILILEGYLPGNLPPIDAAPQRTPAAKAN